MKKVVFTLFLLVLVSLAQKESAHALEKGMLMHLPFEESTKNAVNNQDGSAKNVVFKQGKEGKGAYFDKSSYLRFPARGNINYRRGTVEFWLKPNWDGDDGGYHYFFAGNITDARNVNSIHASKKRYQGGVILGQIDSKADSTGRAIEEAVVPGGRILDPSSVANWKKGDWHHVAFSWDDQKRTLKLYMDGFLRATNDKVVEAAFPSAYESYINIGSSIDEVVFAEAVIDELRIWNYPLSDMQIAKIAGLSEFGKSSRGLNPLIFLGVVLSLGTAFLFWRRDSFPVIRRRHEV